MQVAFGPQRAAATDGNSKKKNNTEILMFIIILIALCYAALAVVPGDKLNKVREYFCVPIFVLIALLMALMESTMEGREGTVQAGKELRSLVREIRDDLRS